MFNQSQVYIIAEWCAERDILGDRITYDEIKAACKSLNIEMPDRLSNNQIKDIGVLCDEQREIN